MAKRHIIDELIEERAPRLVASAVWPLARPLLYALLGRNKAVRMADAVAAMGGAESLDYVSNLLHLDVRTTGLERVPESGRCVVVCNHPTGIADGIAVYDALLKRRPDGIFFANADALRVNPRFAEALIPVEWVEAKRTREKTRATLQGSKDAFEAERCVVMFPAGRLARRNAEGQLVDPPWAPTAVSLAQKYQAPVVPMHLSGPDSLWFHLFNRFSQELRDITLFHEFLNKAGRRFDLTVGPVIAPDTEGLETEALKAYVEFGLRDDRDRLSMFDYLDLSQPQALDLPDEAATIALGQHIAPLLKQGDVIYLTGALGMGKSSLARGIIRALTTPDQDVPSPTFTLIQTYDALDFEIAHLDLYRLKSPEEAYELGLDDALAYSVLLIEWPQHLGHLGFDDRLDIVLEESDNTNLQAGRRVTLTPQGRFRD